MNDYDTIRINLEDMYAANNFKVDENPFADYTKIKELSLAKKTTLTFKEVVELIERAYVKSMVIDLFIDKYPFLEEAINKLGFDGIKDLKYNQKAIKAALLNLSGLSVEHKVIKALKYKTGEFIASKEIKSDLNNVYSDLNINAKCKATDIDKYYDVKVGMRTIDNKRCKGYYILRPKYKVID